MMHFKLWFLIFLFTTSCHGAMNGYIAGANSEAIVSGEVTISDDFSTDISSGWTEDDGNWIYDSGNENVDAPANERGMLSNNTMLDNVNQYVAVEYDNIAASSYGGFYLRYTGSYSDPGYAVRYNIGSASFEWRSCATGADSCSTFATSSSHTLHAGDYVGVEIEGTGNDTVVRIWDFGTSVPARGSWGAATFTFTDNPSTAADTGKYVGLYDGGIGAANFVTFDNFSAGTYTP